MGVPQQAENPSASPVRGSTTAGCGPCIWQQGHISQGTPRHHSPIKALASVFADVLVPVPRHLLSTQLLPSGAAGHMFKSTVVTGNTLLVVETEVLAVFSGKRGSEVGSGAMLVC